MKSEELLNELKPIAGRREQKIEQLRKGNREVILYGAAEKAKIVTKCLNDYDLKFSGYAVDGAYYHEGMTYLDKPVYNFELLSKTPDKYTFIVGMENEKALDKLLNHKELMTIYDLDINKNFETINYKYVEEHIDEFIETYNMLEDDLSRETFKTYLKVKISSDVEHFNKIYDPNQYFNDVTSSFVTTARGGGGIC